MSAIGTAIAIARGLWDFAKAMRPARKPLTPVREAPDWRDHTIKCQACGAPVVGGHVCATEARKQREEN